MQVRFLPPQLEHEWKSSGRMRNLSRKQAAGMPRLWVQVPRLPLSDVNTSGSWSNRKTLVLQTKDSGAIPDESTFNNDDYRPAFD